MTQKRPSSAKRSTPRRIWGAIVGPFPQRMRWFGLWLIGFYSVWLGLLAFGGLWHHLVDNWGMSAAMAAGSYFAGSTPMGGGTVGFPVLVLLFDQPATLGRDFSFAVQSIGMVSAGIYIICRRRPVEWGMLRWAIIGSLIGTPLGIVFIAPHVPELLIKVTFAVLWCSFGVLHFYRLNDIANHTGMPVAAHRFDRNAGLAVGLLGGATVAASTGIGVDMLIYTVLVLLCRADLRVAIPTSVILMAFTSVVGIGFKMLLGDVQPAVFGNWLAAAPVVALGAPLGAIVVELVGRKPTLLVVALLCVGQFVWTMTNSGSQLGWFGIGLSVLAVGVCQLLFEWLHRAGAGVAKRRRANGVPQKLFD